MKTIIILVFINSLVSAQLVKSRWQMIEEETRMSVGGNLTLDGGLPEMFINDTLMGWKFEELDNAYKTPQSFMFAKSFFEYRDDIETSPVYQFIKAMPKGALLHVHASAILGPDFWVYNVTYKEGLYICQDKQIKFKFSNEAPKDPCGKTWKLMKDVRKDAKDVKQFDSELKKSFTLVRDADYKMNEKEIWTRFLGIFGVIWPLWSYRPIWEDYLYEALRTIKDDKVMYVELRTATPELHELDGTTHDPVFFVNVSKTVVDKFVKDFPEFIGAKLICSFNRHGYKIPKDIKTALDLTKNLKQKFPDFIAGFDLVSHEDAGHPLVWFFRHLLGEKDNLDYYFHAGETNWFGMESDQNLIDAVILGSKRIGHANALLKHPVVVEEVVKRKIGIEANVVSNSVLGLNWDVRTHPLASWLAAGLPVTLSSDDPGLWGALPLSTDFYVAFVGVASRNHDLRLLKQLAINSIQHSAMSPAEKEEALKKYKEQWAEFVRAFMANGNNVDYKGFAESAKKKLTAKRSSNIPVRGSASKIKSYSNVRLYITLVVVFLSAMY